MLTDECHNHHPFWHKPCLAAFWYIFTPLLDTYSTSPVQRLNTSSLGPTFYTVEHWKHSNYEWAHMEWCNKVLNKPERWRQLCLSPFSQTASRGTARRGSPTVQKEIPEVLRGSSRLKSSSLNQVMWHSTLLVRKTRTEPGGVYYISNSSPNKNYYVTVCWVKSHAHTFLATYPASISKMRTPRAHQSTAWPWPLLWITSGARYSGVPHKVHVLKIQWQRKYYFYFLKIYFLLIVYWVVFKCKYILINV